MITYAVDFETFYNKTVSIKTLGPLGYFAHPEFDCYMVSVVGSDGYKFVGHPEEWDWSLLEGNTVLSHNASFDQTLYKFGVSRGWYPSVNYHAWHCTADMAAYLGLPRNLAGSCEMALGIAPDKTTRDSMMNKRWENMTDEFKEEVSQYALVDSELCLELWNKLNEGWPPNEREVSRVNREALQKGIPIDQDALKASIERVQNYLFEAEEAIPWLGEKKLLSRIAFNEECRKVGIEPPSSLAQDNPEAVKWIAEHGAKYRWVKSVGEWRRINSMLKKLQAIDNATMEDGRYYGNIMYWGAHTGRFSGGGGNLNLQNLPKKEMFGADLRALISPKEGKKLVVVDLSQIEVRTLLWLADDHETMDEVRNSNDIYEAFAVMFGLWDRDKGSLAKEDNDLRQMVKAIVLGAGFMAGPKAFAATYGFAEEDASKAIDLYRAKMPKVVQLWRKLKEDLNGSIHAQGPLEEERPSGRSIRYGIIKRMKQTIKGQVKFSNLAVLMKHSKKTPVRIWQGLMTENLAQGMARDVFADMMVRIEKEGYDILFHVHDEIIIEVGADKADDALAHIIKIMSTPPEWVDDIPLSAEGDIMDRYEK